MKSNLTFDASKLVAGLQGEARKRGLDGARKGMNDFAAAVSSNAQERTPIESGALMASATFSVEQKGDEVSAAVGFNTAYAAARHERPPEKDAPPKINPKGENKFLEKAMRELTPKMESIVGQRVKDAIG